MSSIPDNAFGRLLRNILPKENFKKKENVSAVVNYGFAIDNRRNREGGNNYWW